MAAAALPPPHSVIALLNPQRAGLLLEDASTNHLGQLLSMAPGVGLHSGPGAWQGMESPLHSTARLQHLRVPLARLPQQAPMENTGTNITLGIRRWGGRTTQECTHMYRKELFPSQHQPQHTHPVLSPDPCSVSEQTRASLSSRDTLHPCDAVFPHLSPLTFFSVTSTWITMGYISLLIRSLTPSTPSSNRQCLFWKGN